MHDQFKGPLKIMGLRNWGDKLNLLLIVVWDVNWPDYSKVKNDDTILKELD